MFLVKTRRAENHVAGGIHCIQAAVQLPGSSSHAWFGHCPILVPVRCWESLPLPPCTHTHAHGATAWSPQPSAETLGWREGHNSAASPFGRSMALAGEEAGDNSWSGGLGKHIGMYCLGTSSLRCTTQRRHETHSLIP